MIWLLYALCSALGATGTAIFSKFGSSNGLHPLVAALIQSIATSCFLLLALVVTQKTHHLTWPTITSLHSLWIAAAGIAAGLGSCFYFLALGHRHVSRVTAVDRLSFAFVMLLSIIIFGEKLSLLSSVGIVLTLIGIGCIAVG